MPKVEYITTDEALMILKCNRSYFYRKHIKSLTLFKDENNHRNYYDKNEVKNLPKSKVKKKAPSSKIKIVRNAESATIN